MTTQNATHIQEPALETLNPQFAQLDGACEQINALYPGKTPTELADLTNRLADHVERDPQPPDEIRKEAAAAQEPAPVPGTAEPAAQEPTPEQPTALHFTSPAEFKAWAVGASEQQIEAYWDSLSDLEFQCLWDDLDDEAAAQEPEDEAALDYLDTEAPDYYDARSEEIMTWLSQIATVQSFYAVNWPFYDHEQAARLTIGCQACGDDFAAMEQTMNTETKAEREARLIAVGAPCAAELIELQARRQTASPTGVREMEDKLAETYGVWFTEKPKTGYQRWMDEQARRGKKA